MTLLSRLATLGLAKETTADTYVAPVRFVPITGQKPEDQITPLKDESIRGNRTVLQDQYQGPGWSTFDYTIPHAYPDVIGDHLRAILGADTTTAGVSTTLSSAAAAAATTISVAASIAANSYISIDTGTLQEYRKVTAVSGAGPYTLTLDTALTSAHASSVAVVATTSHAFKGGTAAPPTYSLTYFNGYETRGYPGCVLNELGVKIDPKGAISCDSKWVGFPSAVQSNATASFSTVQPNIGYQWALSAGGTNSTRGLSLDFTIKQNAAPLDTSDGTQAPREIFAGGVECDFKLKAIFENNNDFTAFLTYAKQALTSTIQQPSTLGGASLALTVSKAVYSKFATDFSGQYVAVDIDGSGLFNATDNGPLSAVLQNFITTTY